MSEAALRQRCRNLRQTRIRSDRETAIIKLLILHACFESGPRPPQRALARELGVWPSYVCKVRKQAASAGWDARIRHGRRVTLDDLEKARRFTSRLREQGLLASNRRLYEGVPRVSSAPRVMTADERIAETWREVAEWKRKNPSYSSGRRVLFSVPVR